jgi:hypothetical protein
MAYAVDTKVPVERTRLAIEKLALDHGATKYAAAYDRDSAMARVEFAIGSRRIRFEMKLPPPEHTKQVRSKWRSLYLVIKAKLESVSSGIETFDEAFLAHVVMPDGRRFGELVQKQLEYAHD